MYDPKTEKLTHISTCFSTHHLMFAEDANNTLWTSGGGPVVGWLNTKMFDETGDEAKSQGWTALILDTNGNGKRDEYVEPNQPLDPTKDKRINAGFYAVAPAPDGSIWGSSLGFPGGVVRLVPGANPPETALAEFYELPCDNPNAQRRLLAARHGRRPQRRRVGGARERPHGELRPPQVQGPAQRPDGDRPALPRGLDVLPEPLPQLKGVTDPGSAEGELLHVGRPVRHARPRRERADQHGQRVGGAARAEGRPVGDAARAVPDGLLHEVDGRPHRRPERRLEGPRPLGDGEHARAVPHGDGKGTTSKVLHFQMRPDPLAR